MRLKSDGEWHKPLQFVRYPFPHLIPCHFQLLHTHLKIPKPALIPLNSNKTDPFEEKEFVYANFKTRIYHEPTYYVDFPDSVRCGRGNMDHASETEVLTVKAGSELQIAHHNNLPNEWKEEDFNCPNGAGTCRAVGKMVSLCLLCVLEETRREEARDKTRQD